MTAIASFDELALLEAVRAAPADDLPRLVLADWYEERGGQPERAWFIRAQCEMQRIPGWVVDIGWSGPNLDRQKQLMATAHKLLRDHVWEWLPPLPWVDGDPGATVDPRCGMIRVVERNGDSFWLQFDRGLVRGIDRVTPSRFLPHAREFVRACPGLERIGLAAENLWLFMDGNDKAMGFEMRDGARTIYRGSWPQDFAGWPAVPFANTFQYYQDHAAALLTADLGVTVEVERWGPPGNPGGWDDSIQLGFRIDAITVNELRRFYNMPPIANGNRTMSGRVIDPEPPPVPVRLSPRSGPGSRWAAFRKAIQTLPLDGMSDEEARVLFGTGQNPPGGVIQVDGE